MDRKTLAIVGGIIVGLLLAGGLVAAWALGFFGGPPDIKGTWVLDPAATEQNWLQQISDTDNRLKVREFFEQERQQGEAAGMAADLDKMLSFVVDEKTIYLSVQMGFFPLSMAFLYEWVDDDTIRLVGVKLPDGTTKDAPEGADPTIDLQVDGDRATVRMPDAIEANLPPVLQGKHIRFNMVFVRKSASTAPPEGFEQMKPAPPAEAEPAPDPGGDGGGVTPVPPEPEGVTDPGSVPAPQPDPDPDAIPDPIKLPVGPDDDPPSEPPAGGAEGGPLSEAAGRQLARDIYKKLQEHAGNLFQGSREKLNTGEETVEDVTRRVEGFRQALGRYKEQLAAVTHEPLLPLRDRLIELIGSYRLCLGPDIAEAIVADARKDPPLGTKPELQALFQRINELGEEIATILRAEQP